MTISLHSTGAVFVLTAPSGGGKTTICRALLGSDEDLCYSISSTTRPPREDERQGQSYDFTSPEEFERLEREGVFLEHAVVHGYRYGTRRDLVEAFLTKGKDVVMDLDVQGAFSLKESGINPVLIFVLPPSMAILESRLRARASDDPEVIARRLKNAQQEILMAHRFDYLMVNNDLDVSIQQMRRIISAERLKASRRRIICRDEAAELNQAYPPLDLE